MLVASWKLKITDLRDFLELGLLFCLPALFCHSVVSVLECFRIVGYFCENVGGNRNSFDLKHMFEKTKFPKKLAFYWGVDGQCGSEDFTNKGLRIEY